MTVKKRRPNQTLPARARRSFERLEPRLAMATDVVLDWNSEVLDTIRASNTAPPMAARNLAIVHAAIFDSVNAITRSHTPYLVDTLANPTSSMEAAVSAAAKTTLTSLYPQRADLFQSKHTAILATIPDGKSESDGVALGNQVAQRILAIRADDGASTHVDYTPPLGPGKWQPTPPANAAALLPQWPNVVPFAMRDGSQFTPNAVPALNSHAYTQAYNQVKDLGSATSTSRTADQTDIALFWANGGGTSTPPGHLNQMATIVAAQRGNSLSQNARLLAMLNIALADAAIMAWDAKYATELWRPITGIRAGDFDGNSATIGDPSWTPLLTTPPFPSYVSGHASFSGAAAAVLTHFYGRDNIRFTLPSENPIVPARSFTSFSQAASESAVSRLYGGIHWSFDNGDGLRAGRSIGDFVTRNVLQKQDRPPVAGIVGTDLIVVGDDRSNSVAFEIRRNDVVVRVAGRSLGTFLFSSFSNLIVDGRGGNDQIFLGNGWLIKSTLLGGSGNDRLYGGNADDVIDAGEGNDFVFGLAGNDQIRGGKGDDYLYGGEGNDTLHGDQGDDTLYGENGIDSLFGDDGDDWLWGGLGEDLLDGGKGRNRLRQ